MSSVPLVEARGLSKTFPVARGLLRRAAGEVRAVDGVSLSIERGECLALVGESGCGKSTVGRLLLRLVEPSAGELRFAGEDLLALSGARLRRRRRHFQTVFQDPFGSLNPRMRAGRAIAEPILIHGLRPRTEVDDRVRELLELVGLAPEAARRYPHELSGGQRQRVAIARALATEPEFLVADEAVSALDVSVQAQIINLLARLQRRLALGLLFISHDLAVVEQIADRVAVMYAGRIVEIGPTRPLFAAPQHPYTVGLLEAMPRLEEAVATAGEGRRARALAGEPPSPSDPPPGCRFHPRCPIAEPRCRQRHPLLEEGRPGSRVACYLPGVVKLALAAENESPSDAGTR